MLNIELLILLAFAAVTLPALLLRRGLIQQTAAIASCAISTGVILAGILAA